MTVSRKWPGTAYQTTSTHSEHLQPSIPSRPAIDTAYRPSSGGSEWRNAVAAELSPPLARTPFARRELIRQCRRVTWSAGFWGRGQGTRGSNRHRQGQMISSKALFTNLTKYAFCGLKCTTVLVVVTTSCELQIRE